MNQKTRSVFMFIAGGYLLFTGGMLVRATLQEEPTNRALFLAAGIGFALFGLCIAVAYLRSFLQYWIAKRQTGEVYEEEETEPPVERKRKNVSVIPQEVGPARDRKEPGPSHGEAERVEIRLGPKDDRRKSPEKSAGTESSGEEPEEAPADEKDEE